MSQQNSTATLVYTSILPNAPRPGTLIPYKRDGRRQWGVCWGVTTYEVQRYKIDGKYPVVEQFIVEPCDGCNMQYILVDESCVEWRLLS
jgi:hypothetical protein